MADETYFWSGYAWGATDESVFVLMNDSSSDRERLTVKSLRARNAFPVNTLNPTTSTPTPGVFALSRTSAQTGGVNVPLVPMNTSAAAVPSEVKVAVFPEVTATSRLRQLMVLPTLATSPLNNPSLGDRYQLSQVLKQGYQDTSTTPVVLAEGEGVALFSGDPNRGPNGMSWTLTLVLLVGTDTFVATLGLTAAIGGIAALGVFNGSGSGVTVNVLQMTVSYVGEPGAGLETTSAPYIRVSRVSGYDGGEVQAPIAMNTNSLLPSSMKVVRGLPWNQSKSLPFIGMSKMGGLSPQDLGYPHTNAQLVRKSATFRQFMIGMTSCSNHGGGAVATTFLQTEHFENEVMSGMDLSGPNAEVSGIVLRKGEGVALIANNNSPFQWLWVECCWVRSPGGEFPVQQLYTS